MTRVEFPPATRPSLLARLVDPANQAAWAEFVALYGPLVFGDLVRRGLARADAEDVTQRVFARLVRAFRSFRYAPARGRFRDWLGVVVRNETHRFQRAAGRRPVMLSPPGGDDYADGAADPEWVDAFQARVLAAAMDRVRPRFEPATWEAFRRVWVDDHPADAVAADLGRPVDWVYVAKSRVLKALAEQVRDLTDDLPFGH